MAIETTFKIKQVNVDEALQEAEAKAQKSAANIDRSLNSAGSGANKMTNTLNTGLKTANSLGAKLGGTLKNVFSGIASGGIWGMAIAGVTMALQKAYEMWKNMTLSME